MLPRAARRHPQPPRRGRRGFPHRGAVRAPVGHQLCGLPVLDHPPRAVGLGAHCLLQRGPHPRSRPRHAGTGGGPPPGGRSCRPPGQMGGRRAPTRSARSWRRGAAVLRGFSFLGYSDQWTRSFPGLTTQSVDDFAMALLLHPQGDAPQDGPVVRRPIPPDAASVCPERHIQHPVHRVFHAPGLRELRPATSWHGATDGRCSSGGRW